MHNTKPLPFCPLKVFEIILLEPLTPIWIQLTTSLDLRRDTLLTTIFALKTVIQYYKSNNTAVYSCFLDASKAFDRVNHFLENCKIEVCLFYLAVSCCTGTEPKHVVSNEVLQPQSFLMFFKWFKISLFDKVGYFPHIYLLSSLVS